MKIIEKLDVYFGLVEDTRKRAYITYELSDILFILVCGMICGCTELERLIEFAELRIDFFKKHTHIEKIPCLATMSNILKLINPEKLELCLGGIVRNVFHREIKDKKMKQICIDGKTICSTVDIEDYSNSIHIVTAILADTSISLGQKVIERKTNEIIAVRELIDMLKIEGSVITMDAMHCQKETIKKKKEKKADYVVQLKSNQGNFYEDVEAMFDEKLVDVKEKENNYDIYETIEKNGGRIEKRKCYVIEEIAYFTDYLADWQGLDKIFAIEREVIKKGKITKERSYYLSSINANARELMGYVRKHWQIESFHWILDVNYGEDASRVSNRNSQICLNIIRKSALGILKTYIDNSRGFL
mgnify:CR=1 FL=1